MEFQTPILLIVFNRPEKTQKLFEIIKKIKPKYFYVSGDGPRQNNNNDIILCNQVRDIFKKIDWNCKFKHQFKNKNLSLKKNVIESINWFFNDVSKGIILEDDCIPSKNFFSFCEILLNKYESNTKIMQINGSNGGLNYENVNQSSYFFSKINSTWGWATWRRAWECFDNNFENYEKNFMKKKIFDYYEDKEIANWMMKYFDKSYHNIDNIWSTNWAYTILKNDGLCISPLENLVENIGFDKTATSSNAEKFSNYRSQAIESFYIKNFADKVKYNKLNDQKYFYELISKIDPRARTSLLNKILNFFQKA